MRKALGILLLLTFLGGVSYFYFNSPLENDEDIEYFNLSLSARFDNRNIPTMVKIISPNDIQYIKTSQSYERIKLPKNQTLKISNVNLEDQYYYEDSREILTNDDNIRIDLKLEEYKNLYIEKDDRKPVSLNISHPKELVVFACVQYSLGYLFVDLYSDDLTNSTIEPLIKRLDENPPGYIGSDKCYSFKTTPLEPIHLKLDYRVFGSIGEGDYINIILIQDQFLGKKEEIIKVK